MKTLKKISHALGMFGLLFLSTGLASAGEIGSCVYNMASRIKEKPGYQILGEMGVNEVGWTLTGSRLDSVATKAPVVVAISFPSIIQGTIELPHMSRHVEYRRIGGYDQTYLESFTVLTPSGFAIRFKKNEDEVVGGNPSKRMQATILEYNPDLNPYVKDGKVIKGDKTIFIASGSCVVKYFTHDDNDAEHEGKKIQPVSREVYYIDNFTNISK